MERCCRATLAPVLLALVLALGLSGCASLWQGSAPPPAPVPDALPPVPQTPVPPVLEPPPPPPPAKPAPPPEPADAVPRVQRIQRGPPNHVYEIRGEVYVPDDTDLPLQEIGLASWYGGPFHGRATANGERYDMNAMTAAHKTMPLPSYARVRNLKNGREVIVRVNDRGPFYPGRVIDLSRAAARRLRIDGLQWVEVRRITHDEIRSGAWRRRSDTAPPRPVRHAAQATAPARP
jgi:rare lipoprotein A